MDNARLTPETGYSGGQDAREIVSHPLISVRKMSKFFNPGGTRIQVLNGVDLDLKAGETLSIAGASGIGKSTLLHLLGTLDRPDEGKIFFQGEDVFQYDNLKLAKFRNASIGFVFQFHYLLPEFSALENVMMPALIRGERKQQAAQAAESMLVRVGLQNRMSHKIGELSGGQQQRVALARALILKPLALLADEPTGNLDKKNSEQVHELLVELNREYNMTLVVVTHNQELASYMGRCVTIVDGQLIEMND